MTSPLIMYGLAGQMLNVARKCMVTGHYHKPAIDNSDRCREDSCVQLK